MDWNLATAPTRPMLARPERMPLWQLVALSFLVGLIAFGGTVLVEIWSNQIVWLRGTTGGFIWIAGCLAGPIIFGFWLKDWRWPPLCFGMLLGQTTVIAVLLSLYPISGGPEFWGWYLLILLGPVFAIGAAVAALLGTWAGLLWRHRQQSR